MGCIALAEDFGPISASRPDEARTRVRYGQRRDPRPGRGSIRVFTGIIEELGTVAGMEQTPEGVRFLVAATAVLDDLRIGDSIAVNGVCLTATTFDATGFGVEAVPETLARTTLGQLSSGSRVNLERPVRAGGRLDGHIVQGHVDGVGTVTAAGPGPQGGTILTVEPASALRRYIVEKGSIAINGVSLTVTTADGTAFSVALIPHTLDVTNLGELSVGDQVNLEVDVIAKYVERLMEPHTR